jgi:hypothetical protein
VLGVESDDLMVVSRDDRAGTEVRYALVSDPRREVARLVLGGPLRALDPAQPHGKYEVRLELADGSFRTPPRTIPGNADIDF